ncbi:MAG: hypothetical protein EOM02_10510 [Synergistales bacterium]|nr:hypothetical protein [Synergistales bacterium]
MNVFQKLQTAMSELMAAARKALADKVICFVVMSPTGNIYSTTDPEGARVLATLDPTPLEIDEIAGLPPVTEGDLLAYGLIALSRLSPEELLPWEEEERVDAQ